LGAQNKYSGLHGLSKVRDSGENQQERTALVNEAGHQGGEKVRAPMEEHGTRSNKKDTKRKSVGDTGTGRVKQTAAQRKKMKRRDADLHNKKDQRQKQKKRGLKGRGNWGGCFKAGRQ